MAKASELLKDKLIKKMLEAGILKEVPIDDSNNNDIKEENPVKKKKDKQKVTKETNIENESSKETPLEEPEVKEESEEKDAISHEEYNKQLTKEQQALKEQIVTNHEISTEEQNMQMISGIRSDIDDIVAVLIASKSFDHLFIYQNVRAFMEIVQKMEMSIDFTYLFVLYENGPRYYGIDEYTPEIKHLFDEIGAALLERKIKTKSDLDKMKNINIFHEIYTDFL